MPQNICLIQCTQYVFACVYIYIYTHTHTHTHTHTRMRMSCSFIDNPTITAGHQNEHKMNFDERWPLITLDNIG